MAMMQPVVFRLGNERYGVDISKVSAIEKGQNVVRVPNASPNIKGIINLRGEVIPVIDLKAKFGLIASTVLKSELILVNLGQLLVALEVDGVEEIGAIEEKDIVPMPAIAKRKECSYFQSVIKVKDSLIIVMDPTKLLSEEEQGIAQQLADSKSE